MILKTSAERPRVGHDAVRWQDAPTLRAFARKEAQRRQRTAAWFNRVRSALTQMMIVAKSITPCIRLSFSMNRSDQPRFPG